VFLELFSQRKSDELSIIVLDNGAFHKAKKLVIPVNIRLVFLPPYAPELNPAEKMWQQFKRAFTNRLFESVEEMRNFIFEQVNSINNEDVMKICACRYMKS
jgi:transposase